MLFTAEIPYGIGIALLLLLLIWGATHYTLRSRRAQKISEDAVREEYRDPEHYQEKQASLEAEAERAEERAKTEQDDDTKTHG